MVLFPCSTKGEIRHFHVVFLRWRIRNVQREVCECIVVSCYFANLNLLLFFAVVVTVAVFVALAPSGP